jgi:hypothetical protein
VVEVKVKVEEKKKYPGIPVFFISNSNFDQFRGNHGELPLQIR